MKPHRNCLAVFIGVWASFGLANAQQVAKPQLLVGEQNPVLRLEAGGPTARVTSMAFSPDGKTLYEAGLDKVVRVWTRDARDQRFEPTSAYRVPLGPGVQGALNALALSPDGKWLAAAGSGAVRMAAGFREPGLVWIPSREALSPEMARDLGTIYVFNTHDGTVRRLRGHGGAVWTLSFVHGSNAPLLASAAWAWDAEKRRFQSELRLWDVAAMQPVATAPAAKLPPADNLHPLGLAAWSVGDRASQTLVAVAAEDGRLRLWNVAAGNVADAKDGPSNSGALYLPDRKRLLTSSLVSVAGDWRAQFRSWDASDGTPTAGDAWSHGEGSSLYWPLALAPVTSRAGKIEYVAAVCFLKWKEAGEEKRHYWLCLFDLDTGKLAHEQPLWKAQEGDDLPVAAVGPRGRHIAVAGNREHAIYVFALDDLIAKKRQPPLQELHSVGAAVRRIDWVQKQGETGLRLRRAAGDDHVFEFGKATRLTNDVKAWRVVPGAAVLEADLARWRRRHTNATTTAAALLPPGILLKDRRLLAVGYDEGGETGLGLYDADTGDQVRELTGHLASVRSLAFSADGKRLASAADDQTVSVWDLSDLPALLNRRGTLRGVNIVDREDQKGLAVTRVEGDSSAAGKLQGGDLILGLVENGKLRPYDVARDFYVALSERKPGDNVMLRLTNGKEVTLPLDPVIDERKPLLSLFVTRDQDWIGWSPTGPYESSGLKAEGYLGWHIGTDKAARPTAFALAKEYHKDYHKPGALRELLETGKVAPPVPPPPPKPRMTLWIGEPNEAPANKDAQGRFVLRRRVAVLHLQVDDFPPDLIDTVTWQLDDGKVETFAAARDSEWSADLSDKVGGARSPHIVSAMLRTRGDDPRQYPAEIAFRYQPLPPMLTLIDLSGQKLAANERSLRLESKAAAFALKLEASPGPANEKIDVRLTHLHKNKEASKPQTWNVAQRTTLEPRLTLVRGLNTIEIIAANAAAPAGDTQENARLLLQVDFEPEPVRILLREIMPLPTGAVQPLDGKDGDAVTVHSGRVRVTGVVDTKGDPKAKWRLGANEPTALTLAKDKTFAVELDLKPGGQEFTFTASTDGANSDTAALKVRFAPLPPAVVLTEPEPVYEGEHKGDVAVRGTLKVPPGSAGFKYEMAVLVNGEVVKSGTPAVNEKEQSVEANLPLKPGAAYRVEMRLTNEWHQATRSNAVLARYWSPPTNFQFAPVAKTVKKPLVDLKATVQSRLPLTRAEATVRGGMGEDYPIPKVHWQRGKADNSWDITLKDVPLGKGRNDVRLWAVNEQGKSRQTGELEIQYEEPAEPPVVRVDGPAHEEVRARDYALKFHVHSKAPLQLVEVAHNKKTYPSQHDLSKLPQNDESVYELKDAVQIALQPGINHLEIVAVNEGGTRRAAVEVSFVVVPVRLELDELLTTDGKSVALQRSADGAIVAPHAPDPRLTVRGRIVWDDPNDPLLRGTDQWVRVYVNGFQQRPAELQPPADGQTERHFETEVLLNRAADNRMEFELPSLRRSAQSRPRVEVRECGKFQAEQWLHLLILGAGDEDGKTLQQGVLKAVGAREEKPDQWRTDVFERVQRYGPLTLADDNLTPEAVQMQLVRIRAIMRGRRAAGAGDIVLIYFKGGELIDDKGHFLLTGGRARTGAALPSADLARFFTSSRGAQLLFLDVVRANDAPDEDDQFKKWQDDPQVTRVGVFRSALKTNDPKPAAGEAVRLDRALQEEMPKAALLGGVEKRLRAKYKDLASLFPKEIGQLPYFYVYPLLEDLVISQKSPR